MSNVIDYLNWRGDLSFEVSEFNEADSMVLSLISYVDWSGIVPEDYKNAVYLKDAAKLALENDDLCHMIAVDEKAYRQLLDLCICSKRFSDIKLLHYISKISYDIQMQFAALVFDIGTDIVICFRGTDDTIVGWQEDFNMSILKTVPSQSEALNYFISTANRFTKNRFILCGHSKGGNLAVFSAIMSPEALTDRIKFVYSLDGPGFMSSNVDSDKYKKLQSRITTYVPQSSIVGMFLDHEEKHIVIKSSASGGIAQHNGLTWEVLGNSFIHLEETDKRSRFIEKTFKDAIAVTSVEERTELAVALSQIIDMLDNNTLTGLVNNIPSSIVKTIKGYDALSDSSKRIVMFFARTIISNGQQNLGNGAKKEAKERKFKFPLKLNRNSNSHNS
ncbi:MAG: DUF2974 domain-containing protein [Clostridia bacterium]|nr:DUF2974 domain-containing protein [Clostridia bacterium]